MSTVVSEISKTEFKNIRILIVEDEYILAMNLQESIEALGYSVLDITDSGEASIKKAAALRPNLVLMDIRLRGKMDGIQAAEVIWNQLQIPVIYVTGHSDQTTVERATLSFPFGYILKPIREKELYVAIQTALTRYDREQFLSTVLQQMGDGVIVADPDLRVKYLNQVAEVMTGWTLSEAREKDIREVARFVDEKTQQPIPHPLVSALQQKSSVFLNGDALLVQKTGALLPVTDSAVPIKDNHGRISGAVLVFRDDTRRRLIEERNLAAERARNLELRMIELQRLDRLKDDFLATTSHELRTPLASIKLAICMLENVLNQQQADLGDRAQSESINRYLNILQDQCDQELKLVNDLLDIRSLDADAYPLDPAPIALDVWLPHIVEGFEERAIAQQQALQVYIPSNVPVIVSDMPSLTRITSELINNACKYTPAYKQIHVTVNPVYGPGEIQDPQLDAFPNGPFPYIQLIICNSGVTIEPTQLSQIFNPFYRVPNGDPWKHGGTGLGLALVKKLVTHLKGMITVTSREEWVTFTVSLPLTLTLN